MLSQNRHIAQTMSSEPAIRAVLVGELRRQVKGWNSSPSQSPGASDSDPDYGSGPGSGSDTGRGGRGSGDGRNEPAQGGVGAAGEGRDRSRPPPASIVVDPIHLTLTLETLKNVMRGSRRRRDSGRKESDAAAAAAPAPAVGSGSGAGAGWGSQPRGDDGRVAPAVEEEVPWPFRSLYGEDNYYYYYYGGGGAGEGDGSYDAGAAAVALGDEAVAGSGHWPLDRKLVADIAELMLSAASVRESEAVRLSSGRSLRLPVYLESVFKSLPACRLFGTVLQAKARRAIIPPLSVMMRN